MQNNNKEYFALKVINNLSLRKEYPKKVYPFTYEGIEMFCYQSSIGQWDACEKTTGLPMAISFTSKIGCMAQTRQIIKSKGRDKSINDIRLAREALNTMDIYEDDNE